MKNNIEIGKTYRHRYNENLYKIIFEASISIYAVRNINTNVCCYMDASELGEEYIEKIRFNI